MSFVNEHSYSPAFLMNLHTSIVELIRVNLYPIFVEDFGEYFLAPCIEFLKSN